jgi:hypothetical protein
MPTYKLISSSTVSGSTTDTVTFSSIPQTYTDLALLFSGRNSRNTDTLQEFRINLNNNTSSNYHEYLFRATGAALSFYINLSRTTWGEYGQTTNQMASNLFSNYTLYFTRYTSSYNKTESHQGVTEQNATTAYAYSGNNIWINTAAINSISITSAPTYFMVADTTFYLYGISDA